MCFGVGSGAPAPAPRSRLTSGVRTVPFAPSPPPANLDLDLAEARRDAPPVAHRHLVVHDLRHPRAGGVDEPHASPHRGQPRHRHELGLAHVGADHVQRRLGRLLRAALEGQLVALEHAPGLLGRRRRRQLQRPALAGAMAQRDAPAREPQVGRVEVDGLQAQRLGRPPRPRLRRRRRGSGRWNAGPAPSFTSRSQAFDRHAGGAVAVAVPSRAPAPGNACGS